jgi:hypothetical protein
MPERIGPASAERPNASDVVPSRTTAHRRLAAVPWRSAGPRAGAVAELAGDAQHALARGGGDVAEAGEGARDLRGAEADRRGDIA